MKIEVFVDDYDDIVRCAVSDGVKLPRMMFVIDDMEIAVPPIPDERIKRFINTVKLKLLEHPTHNHNGVSHSTEGEYPAFLFSSSVDGGEVFGYTSNYMSIRVCLGNKCVLEVNQFLKHCENHGYCHFEGATIYGKCEKNHSVFTMNKHLPNEDLIKALKIYLEKKPL